MNNVDKAFVLGLPIGYGVYGIAKIADKTSHAVFDTVENWFDVETPDWIENYFSFGLGASFVAALVSTLIFQESERRRMRGE
ncbi:MAG: hypothetical protein AAB439_03085 [Patescibacteria group bacterium]